MKRDIKDITAQDLGRIFTEATFEGGLWTEVIKVCNLAKIVAMNDDATKAERRGLAEMADRVKGMALAYINRSHSSSQTVAGARSDKP